jgi:PIN domain nuclease of toxin-antitoxin system
MLLDTHTWLWAALHDKRRLGPRTAREIERAASRGSAEISVASIFELTALAAAGRVRFATSAETWVRQSIEIARLQVAELTLAIAVEAGSIPTMALPDPIDRLLVATARNLDIPIVTRDARILDYIRTSRIGRAIDASR